MACVITHLQHGTNFIPYVESPSHGAGHPSLSVEVFNQGKNMSNSNTWNNTSFLSDGVILPKEVSHITDYIITLGTR